MKLFGKKRKLYDGYILSLPLSDRAIHFYRDSALNRVLSGESFKVDEEKVLAYEDMCETYRENFMEMGWLRLHTPLEMNQEPLGTDFLYIPPKERNRILEMLEGGVLYSLERFKLFCVVEEEGVDTQTNIKKELEKLPEGYRAEIKGTPEELAALGLPAPVREIKSFTVDELIGSGELVDLSEIGNGNRERIEKGIISEEDVDKQIQSIQETKFYFIMGFSIKGMFIYKNHPEEN